MTRRSRRFVAAIAAAVIGTVGTGDVGALTRARPRCAPYWATVAATSAGGIYAIDGVTPSDVWGVGDTDTSHEGPPLIVHWNGSALERLAGPAVSDPAALHDVAVLASDDAWAVGTAGGRTLIEHWDGDRWSVVESPNVGWTTNTLYAVSAVSPRDVWAVGDIEYAVQPLILHWNGRRWRTVSAAALGGHPGLEDVEAVTSDLVWAIGRDYIARWDGVSWSLHTVLEPHLSIQGISAVSSTAAWVVGEIGVDDGEHDYALVGRWDGTSWTFERGPTEGHGDDGLWGVAAISPTDIWAAGGAAFHRTVTGDNLAGPWGYGPTSIGSQVWSFTGGWISRICPSLLGDGGFDVARVRVPLGRTISWRVPADAGGAHSIVDRRGLGPSSPELRPGDAFDWQAHHSGTFVVTDPVTGSQVRIAVPLDGPREATVREQFRIGWRAYDSNDGGGLVADVEVQRPGADTFAPLVTDRADHDLGFTPDAGPGTYRFRARVEDPTTRKTSLWSPILSVVVE